jgi:hypothetical protein
MSEVGSGDVRDLRNRVAWAARADDRSPRSYETGRWLRDLSSLAHAEVDWDGGSWVIAPAAGVLLPFSGGTAVLAGSRRVGLVEQLSELDVAVQLEARAIADDGPLPLPTSVYVQADSMADLADALTKIGVTYFGCAAKHLATGLHQIGLGAPAAPPARDATVEHLVADADEVRFVGGVPSGDGLCRLSVLGRPSYLYREDGSWYHTDRASGIFYDLAARGINAFRWRRDRTSGDQEIGTVFVDQGAPLPPLQARALVLCTGLPPEFGNLARTAIYRNVPKETAILVARSIHQKVAIVT